MTNCKHCQKPMKPIAANLLCASCRETYWQLIRQLGHVQLPALRSIMLRQARIGTTSHTPNKGNAPLPIDARAQDLIAESEAWLAEQAGKIRTAYAGFDWRKAWYAIVDAGRRAHNPRHLPKMRQHAHRHARSRIGHMPRLPQGMGRASNQSSTRRKTMASANHRHAQRCGQGAETIRPDRITQSHQPMAQTRQTVARHADGTQAAVQVQPRRVGRTT